MLRRLFVEIAAHVVETISDDKRMAVISIALFGGFMLFFAPSWISSPSDFWVTLTVVVALGLGGSAAYFLNRTLPNSI